jgi:hypothetical protein
MKMKSDDYLELCSAMLQVVEKYGPERLSKHRAALIDDCKDINVRMAWDIFHLTGIRIGDGAGIKTKHNWYSYLNDTHLNTAMVKCYTDKIKPMLSA